MFFNPMGRRFSLNLRFLLFLYALASMTYFVATAAAVYDQVFHMSRHVQDPFRMDFDNMSLTDVSKEAQSAGLAKGDVVESLDGHPYGGEAQWRSMDQYAHPGEMMQVGVRTPQGTRRTVNIRLLPGKTPQLHAGEWFMILALQIFCTLVCLVTGYWVVLAKPREPNAWLILLLLTFPEVLFASPSWWSGPLLVFVEAWYQVMQVAGPLVVFLLGVYFPERWRLDRKLPWLKWILIVPQVVEMLLILIAKYGEYYDPAMGGLILRASPWIDRMGNPLALICVILYWVAIFDKLRSASTADARRRMRVLCAGSVIGLGSLLVVFVFLRDFGIEPTRVPWLAGIGATLSLFFPFALGYVVVVQRALDVSILVRMGTRYLLARSTLVVLQLGLLAFIAERVLALLLMKKRFEWSDAIIPIVLAAVLQLGRSLQRWLDRKFFREQYTAELVLHELSEQARKSSESDSLLPNILKRVSEVLHVPQIGLLLRGGPAFCLQQAVGLDMSQPVILPETSQTVQNLLRENRPATLYRDNPESWFAQAEPEERKTLDAVNAEVVLALPGRDRLMGVMTLGPKLSEQPYSPSDLRLLQSVATQAGLSLEVTDLAHSLAREAAQRERFNREIEIAREVQERLFPQITPQFSGISLAGACRPALGVGGDYYDFIELEGGRLGLAVGDVSGKGISAALLMASLRASLRGMTLEGAHDLARLMSNVNRLVYEASAANRYATFFFSIFNPQTRELNFVNAGHNPPVVLRNRNNSPPEVLRLEAGGPVVGLLPNLPYEAQSVVLCPGDLLVAYTDGISEAMTLDDEEWGEDLMIASAEAVRTSSAREIVTAIFAAADKFTGGAPQHDDMTLLVLKLEN